MPTIPGTIDLGKFWVVYEEEREQGSGDSGGYLVQERAIIRLNEELVKLAQQHDLKTISATKNKPVRRK